jgi:transposase
MGKRGDLTNEQWERIEPLLPKAKTKRGRPAQDHRQLLNGMLWMLRTGASWRDMPERYGKWTTIYSRFQRWRKSGTWDKMFAHLQTALDEESNVDWEVHFIDSTTVRAHQHAAGAKKSSPQREALGRSRGGFTTKIHLRCEGTGRLITFLLTPGQESDVAQAEGLLEAGLIRRSTGHWRLRPKRLIADKGYTSRAFRKYLHQRHICCTILHRRNEHHQGAFEPQLYQKRKIVERLINRLKQFRRIATRYEKRAANFSAMITLASIFLR